MEKASSFKLTGCKLQVFGAGGYLEKASSFKCLGQGGIGRRLVPLSSLIVNFKYIRQDGTCMMTLDSFFTRF